MQKKEKRKLGREGAVGIGEWPFLSLAEAAVPPIGGTGQELAVVVTILPVESP